MYWPISRKKESINIKKKLKALSLQSKLNWTSPGKTGARGTFTDKILGSRSRKKMFKLRLKTDRQFRNINPGKERLSFLTFFVSNQNNWNPCHICSSYLKLLHPRKIYYDILWSKNYHHHLYVKNLSGLIGSTTNGHIESN